MSKATDLISNCVECHARAHHIIAAFGGRDRFHHFIAAADAIGGSERPDDHRLFATALPAQMERLDALWFEGHRPSLPDCALGWLTFFGIRPDAPEGLLTLLTALRAETVKGRVPESARLQPDEPPYHSRVHTLEVFSGACLLASHTPVFSDARLRALLMTAALMHDIDHPGAPNPKEMPFFNEDASFACGAPLIEAVYGTGPMTAWAGGRIKTMLRFTDAAGPHRDLIEAMALRAAGARTWNSSPRLKERFANAVYTAIGPADPLWEAAAILRDADLAFSIVLAARSEERLTLEAAAAGMSQDFSSEAARRYFRNEIFARSFISRAGLQVLQPHAG